MEGQALSLAKKEKDVAATQVIIEKATNFKRKQLTLQTQMKNMAEPKTFVLQKKEYNKELRDNQNWKRKIEIAQLEAKKARMTLKRRTMAEYQY
jgi:hypothetical protein